MNWKQFHHLGLPVLGELIVVVALLALSGCRESSPEDLCLRADLGQYRFRGVVPEPDGGHGCVARYQEDRGATAVVRVVQGRPFLLEKEVAPAQFEKHLVYSWPGSSGLRVSWHHADVGVEATLSGLREPQGPVLRAYLMKYPSDVTSEMVATEREIENLRTAGHETPRNAAIHLNLARKYRKLGNTIMATQEYHISVELDPLCYDCYLELGVLYRELRHWDLSIRAFRRSINLRPSDPQPHTLIGDVYYEVHNRDESLRAYHEALAAGLGGEERVRVEKRMQDLENGRFMIEVVPGAKQKPGH